MFHEWAAGLAFALCATQAFAGSISGTVYFSGKVPAPERFTVIKNTAVCGAGIRAIEWVRARQGKLAGTVVALDNISGGSKAWDKRATAPRLDQKDCAFIPYLDVIRNGAELTILNHDPVLHNIHAYEILGRARRTMFNLIQPGKGLVFKEKVKARRGRWMELACDTHDFMHGWRFLARNSYYAVTDDNGAFRIMDVPPGKYTVAAYHPTLGSQRTMLNVGEGVAEAVDFTFSGD